ncbi:hypothetical protein [Eremococcus coleocola]|uniref:hypothetical protein n=1 Tax=Eremococcus coleocola TaxID=88132 RepID=UPI00040B9CEB|nr:hypothetical protein [Eremococcus coleocola]
MNDNLKRLNAKDTWIKSGYGLEDEKPYPVAVDYYGDYIMSNDDQNEYIETEEKEYLYIDKTIKGLKDSQLYEFLIDSYLVVTGYDLAMRGYRI